VALRNISATDVAEGLINIFARTGIPIKIISDQGTQFVSRVLKHVYTILGIDTIQTSPYHPQGNGVVERMHGVLKPMLAKAHKQGVDWTKFLPLALFVLRQVHNRDIGVSPHELVYGRKLRGPLDVLYSGWVDETLQGVSISKWVDELAERLEVLRDVATCVGKKSGEKRKCEKDKGRTFKEVEVGEKVLVRIPGICSNLQDAWEGPPTLWWKSVTR